MSYEYITEDSVKQVKKEMYKVKNKSRVHKAVNWNKRNDIALMFWEQNIKQMWTDTEFVVSKDRAVWDKLDPKVQDAYKRVLGGLTLLDTKQSTVGMPKIAEWVDDLQDKSVLSFMGMMEAIHAKSYSTIFTTLLSNSEIDEVFEWVEQEPHLQYKAEHISYYYENINDKKDLYLAMVASVFLESFLFYSGFFLPLWLAGSGKMVASGEIIKKILMDESIHGVYVGILAQQVYQELTPEEQEMVDFETTKLLEELMENEMKYTESIYVPLKLDHEVKNFLIYNANKAMQNLGRTPHYEDKKINPVVQNGIDTNGGTIDFFSMKGHQYVVAKHSPLTDKDFNFEDQNLEDDI